MRLSMNPLLILFSFAGLALMSCQDESPATMADQKTDPYLWLEEVEGEQALAWVREQNERTLGDLQSDPDYPGFEAAALEILTSNERIPYGRIRDRKVYNFWQDETNVRGLWRRTSLESYREENPKWETVLDFDELAEREGKNWVFKGSDCFHDKKSGGYRCLVSLSDGGKDAVVKREFDLETLTFVEGGFVTPEAKQGSAWAGPDVLLIGTDWGEGSLTDSGYPRIVKRWERGAPLSEATELLAGDTEDVGVWPYTIEMADGRIFSCVEESDTFFTSTHWWIPNGETTPVKIPVPPKCGLSDVLGRWMFILLKEDWEVAGELYQSGDLVSFDLEEFVESRSLPTVRLVFRPSETQAVNSVSVAGTTALLSLDDKVTGQVLRLEERGDKWMTHPIDLPGAGQAGIAFADEDETTAFLTYEGFLTPDSLFEYDTKADKVSPLKSLPPKFDTTGLVVEQFFATSTDGTRIPYFAVHREDVPLNGTTPTLLYGYGGF